jgi:fatty-acyl-CoA synthase
MTPTTARDWILAPRRGRGIHLADDARGWRFHEYADLADRARRVAGALIADGIRPGDGVAVLMPTGLECLAAIYGAWAAGATLTPIAPPMFEDEDEYSARVAAIVHAAGTRVTVTTEAMAGIVARAHAAAGREDGAWTYREAAPIAELAPVDELALVQFTSGSTTVPRGVRVGWDNLEANLALMHRMVGWREGDGFASWLPLYHDMGFVGALLVPVSYQGNLWLMRPDQFIRDPLRWVRCFEHAQHTALPPFAVAYAARRIRPEQLEGLDLSGWRTAIVAAEPVSPGALEDFARLAAPAGFSRSVFLGSYGLAEATLAVCAAPLQRAPRTVAIASDELRVGARIPIVAQRPLGPDSAQDTAGWLVACGSARHGAGLRILDDDGEPLPDGHLGEIAVTGPSVARGYSGEGAEGTSTRFVGRELRTGDAGFLLDGELFVLGRMGTSLKVRGRNVFVEDLEQAVIAATDLPANRVAVVADTGPAGRAVALLVEGSAGPWADVARRTLAAALGPEIEITIVVRGRGLIHRTSSGKPRRRYMWERLRAGLPDGSSSRIAPASGRCCSARRRCAACWTAPWSMSPRPRAARSSWRARSPRASATRAPTSITSSSPTAPTSSPPCLRCSSSTTGESRSARARCANCSASSRRCAVPRAPAPRSHGFRRTCSTAASASCAASRCAGPTWPSARRRG